MPAGRAPQQLLLARDFPPMDGGMARLMAALVRGYPPGSLTVSTGTMAGSAAADALLPQRVDRVAVPADHLRTLAGVLAWSRRAVTLAHETGATFVWCDTIRPAGYAAHWTWRRTRVPYGIVVVGNDLLTLGVKVAGSPIKRRAMRRVLGRAAVFVAISEWTAGQCRALLGELRLPADADHVRVVPLGTDPVQWRGDRAAAADFRRRRGLPEGRWLVTVARLVDYKGIDTAIGLLARLRADYPELRYAVIGRGPDAGRLQALAQELGVADRVHLIHDVDDDELPAAYSSGEIYVGLTRETSLDVEGFGISFAEAAACGLPAVGARAGGIPDAVVDGETGILVEPGDVGDAERAVRQLLADPALAQRMGAAGRARVERYLNWERVVGEMRAIAGEFGKS